MKRISRLGLISASIYIIFVVFCVVRTEFCFRDDGLICAIGYFLPGLPWSLSVGLIPNTFIRSLGELGDAVFFAVVTISTLLNLYLSYWYGRVLEEGRRSKVE
jgi:membrane protein DedA with SNARE-associated domain